MWKNIRPSIIIFLWITAWTGQTTSIVTRFPQATSTSTSSLRITIIPVSSPSLGDHFPQQINTPNAYMDALIEGELVINSCLRVNDSSGQSFLLIWPPIFSTRAEQGIVQVIDHAGQEVASVGDFVEVGGGEIPTPTYLELANPLPEDCLGPYWLVSDYIKKIDTP